MKIVIAPNALKGSLSAARAADAMAAGAAKACPRATIKTIPVADGGDGLVDVLITALGGEMVETTVDNPLGKPIQARFCHVPDRRLAVIEMATASGLALLQDSERNPLLTSTMGTGQLIQAALDKNIQHLIIGIGGSATNEGGIGMAQSLGVQFTDARGHSISPVGQSLIDIQRIDISGLDPRLQKITIDVICDVNNPLLGNNGATRVYGPQKGATPEDQEHLEKGLHNLADVIQRDLNKTVHHLPGAGAAGGLGAGLHAFLNARLRPGMDIILELLDLKSAMTDAQLVLTAEGQIDFQTAFGKAPAGVAALAKSLNIPCIAIAGSLGEGLEQLHPIGITALFSLCSGPISLASAMDQGEKLLTATTEQVVRGFLATTMDNSSCT